MSYNVNVLLFLGKSGVEKSLCINNFSNYKNINVSDSKESSTKEINGYNCNFPSSLISSGLHFKLVDTSSLNDSVSERSFIVSNIKKFLINKSLKVKGIFIF